MHKFLRSAINLARNHEYDDQDFMHAAVIVRGGAVLSVGYNCSNKNSFVDYVSKVNGLHYSVNMHSEMAAILSVRNKIDLRGCKLYVVRVKPTGVGMSKPCVLCQHTMRRYGISKCYYSIDETNYGVMKL